MAAIQQQDPSAALTVLRAVLESAPEHVFVWGRDRRCLYLNAAAAADIGRDIRDVLAERPDILERWPGRLEQVFTDEQPLDVMDQTPNGDRTIWCESHLSVLRDSSGRVFALCAICRDVTERENARQALARSEERYRTVVEGAGEAIVVIDADGVVQFANGTATQRLGIPREQVVGKRMWELFHKEMADRHMTVIGEVIRSGRGRSSMDSRELIQGQWRWYRTCVQPLRDDRGDVSAALIIARDVTARKQAEQALRESEAKYRALTESVEDIVYTMDDQGRLTYVSPQVARYGLDPKAMDMMDFRQFVVPEDRQAAFADFEQTIATGQEFPTEFRVADAHGRVHWLEERGRAVRDESGRIIGLVGVLRDVTDHKEAEAVARHYRDRLRQLAGELSLAQEKERRHLATEVHDDLGQLLALVRIRMDLLRRAETLDKLRHGLSALEPLVERADRVARSLIVHLSHPILYDIGFAAAARWLADDMGRLYGLVVHIDDDEQPKPLGEAPRVMLYQCLREALANVAKHAGVSEAQVALRRAGPMVRVTVADRGVGFDPAGIARKADAGFGLFSIHERLEPLGGRLEIQSAVGQGTTVILEVPVETQRQENPSSPGDSRSAA